MNEQQIADLKAELEMPTQEEFEELRKQVELLEAKLNELVNWLTQLFPDGEDKAYMTQFLKVKQE